MKVFAATLGNMSGGMVTSGIGWLSPQTKPLRYVDKLRQYGTPALLLAWAPLLGGALCLAVGWLRFSWWKAVPFMTIGKFARYWVLATTLA